MKALDFVPVDADNHYYEPHDCCTRRRNRALAGGSVFRPLLGARPAQDTLAARVLHGLFDRFPKLRVAITSQGGAKATRASRPPREVFLEHIFVAPFFEDDVYKLVDTIGARRVLFGSDWPHPEGIAAPLDFLDEVEKLPADALRLIMRDNTAGLLRLQA